MSKEKSLIDKLNEEFDKHHDEYMKFMHPDKQSERSGKFNLAHIAGGKEVQSLYESLKEQGKIPKRGKEIDVEHINSILEKYLEGFVDKLGDEHHKITLENYKNTTFENKEKRLEKLHQIYAHMGLSVDGKNPFSETLSEALKDNDFEDISEFFTGDVHQNLYKSFAGHTNSKKFTETIGHDKYKQKGFGKRAIEKIDDGKRYMADLDKDGKGAIHGKEVVELKGLLDNAANQNFIYNKEHLKKVGVKPYLGPGS